MARPSSATERRAAGAGPEPVALVRAYIDAWNRRDLEALGAALDPDVQWARAAEVADCSAAFPERREIAGRDSLLEFAEVLFEVFDETSIEVERCVDGPAGEVVIAGTTRFRGRGSGLETLASWARAYTVGKRGIARIESWA